MDAATIKSKLARIIGAGPKAAVILPDGSTVDGVRCTIRASQVAALPGYQAQYRGSVVVTVPATMPTVRALFRVDGVWYRILGMEPDSARAGLRLDMGEGASQQ